MWSASLFILNRGGVEPMELYHYGVPGMKWGVRRSKAQLNRARKTSAKMVKRYKSGADYFIKTRDNIRKNDYEQYKKYGYPSKEHARADDKNWNKLARVDRRIANEWSNIHKDISKMTINDVKEAKKLVAVGKAWTRKALLNAGR